MASQSQYPDAAQPAPEAFASRPIGIPAVDRTREPRTRYIVLFLLTVVSTTIVGASQYAGFMAAFTNRVPDIPASTLFIKGFLTYSVPALAILGSHEFGHYYACRYYGVDASLPYFLPAPPFFLFGTFGAVIRIRQPLPSKRALFDIGIAGPIAGFLVAVPVLILGIYLSPVLRVPENLSGVIQFGEPLLFKLGITVIHGVRPDGYDVNMHPTAMAAWFGLLATALNLMPIGQLDGGHISYAVLGQRSVYVTLATVAVVVSLISMSLSWVVWSALTIAMLYMFGIRHPPVWDEHVPLDRTRLWLAAFALLMFAVCFMPAPITPLDLLGQK